MYFIIILLPWCTYDVYLAAAPLLGIAVACLFVAAVKQLELLFY